MGSALKEKYPLIELSVDLDINFPTVSERYFTHYFFLPKSKSKNLVSKEGDIKLSNSSTISTPYCTNNDTCVMMHSNRICVLSLSPRHPIIKEKKSIVKVDYDVHGTNRLSNKVSGKGKRGAQVIGLYSVLCILTCTDESSYEIFTGMKGKLIEVNSLLIQNPNLITTAPQSEGYLAIVLPKLHESKYIMKNLLSSAEYNDCCGND